MAGLHFTVTAPDQTITGGSPGDSKTLIRLISPSVVMLRLTEWGVSFQGTGNNDEPLRIQLAFCSTESIGGTSAVTPTATVPIPSGHSVQSTAQTNFSTEPATVVPLINEVPLHPQLGATFPFSIDKPLVIGPGVGLCIRVVDPSDTVDCTPHFAAEE